VTTTVQRRQKGVKEAALRAMQLNACRQRGQERGTERGEERERKRERERERERGQGRAAWKLSAEADTRQEGIDKGRVQRREADALTVC